jgi:hypothetical protein
MITKEQAMNLTYRQVIVDTDNKRWYITGKCKTWKRDANRFQVPLKHGLYTYGYLNNENNQYFILE